MLPATSPAGSSKTPTPSPAAGPGSVGRCERPESHERDGGKREGGREGGWIRVRCIRGKDGERNGERQRNGNWDEKQDKRRRWMQ